MTTANKQRRIMIFFIAFGGFFIEPSHPMSKIFLVITEEHYDNDTTTKTGLTALSSKLLIGLSLGRQHCKKVLVCIAIAELKQQPSV
jgi:hypothetical protein